MASTLDCALPEVGGRRPPPGSGGEKWLIGTFTGEISEGDFNTLSNNGLNFLLERVKWGTSRLLTPGWGAQGKENEGNREKTFAGAHRGRRTRRNWMHLLPFCGGGTLLFLNLLMHGPSKCVPSMRFVPELILQQLSFEMRRPSTAIHEGVKHFVFLVLTNPEHFAKSVSCETKIGKKPTQGKERSRHDRGSKRTLDKTMATHNVNLNRPRCPYNPTPLTEKIDHDVTLA